jgi:hypothetical protein
MNKMNENEYIEFIIPEREQFESLKKLFYQIKYTHNNNKDYEIDSFLSKVPEYVFEFYTKENNQKGWSLPNLISFLIEDLDVTYLEISEKEKGFGRLDFEANGYPYGEPNSLIIFLKSFNMIPYKVFEGIETLMINWISEFEYKLEHKKEIIKWYKFINKIKNIINL